MRQAYIESEALVKRCLNKSHKSWNDMARASLRSPPGGSRPSYRPSTRARGNSLSDAPLGGDFLSFRLFLMKFSSRGMLRFPASLPRGNMLRADTTCTSENSQTV